jgi:hypothetical protein
VNDNSEGTTFVQWRQRAQSEVRADRPGLRTGLIVAAVVVIIALVAAAVFVMS